MPQLGQGWNLRRREVRCLTLPDASARSDAHADARSDATAPHAHARSDAGSMHLRLHLLLRRCFSQWLQRTLVLRSRFGVGHLYPRNVHRVASPDARSDARSDADASSCMQILHTYVVPWTHVHPVQHSGLQG